MKKVSFIGSLLLMVMTSYVLTACGSDGDEHGGLSISPSSVSMHYEDTKQLNADGATSWTTSDEFVATVDTKGLVTGGHVGKAQIIASNGSASGLCDVEITPEYFLYDDPVLDWGISMSSVKSSVDKELVSSDTNSLIYKYTISGDPCLINYGFENNKLKSVLCLFSYTYYLRSAYYLVERYQPVYKGDDYYGFMDAMKVEKAKTLVVFREYKSGSTTLTQIIYGPATTSSSNVAKRAQNVTHGLEKVQAEMAKYFE